jgi:hypothetical protein
VTNQLESMRGQDKRSPSVTEEESINSAWALFLLRYNNTGKFQTLLQECDVGEKCIMYLFCSSRFAPCNSSATSVYVEFYSRHTHSVSRPRRYDDYSSTRVGRVVRLTRAEGTEGRQTESFILNNIFCS